MKFSIIYSGKVELPEFEPILGSEKTVLQKQNGIFFSNSRWLTEAEIGSTEDLREHALGFHIPKCGTRFWTSTNVTYKKTLQMRLETKFEILPMQTDDFLSTQEHTNLRTLMLRTSSTGEIMVLIQFFENKNRIDFRSFI
jgi:23S rRNA (uracil1939-C5)-methyltransferase